MSKAGEGVVLIIVGWVFFIIFGLITHTWLHIYGTWAETAAWYALGAAITMRADFGASQS